MKLARSIYWIKNVAQNWDVYLGQMATVGMFFAFSLFIWNTLVLLTGCSSPIIVVLSGSMEPSFYRGDLLIMEHHSPLLPQRTTGVGDVVCFDVSTPIPIVHRIVRVFENETLDALKILTKGDANQIHDRWLYPSRKQFISHSEIVGTIQAIFPYVGYVAILLNEYPWIKPAVVFVPFLLSFA